MGERCGKNRPFTCWINRHRQWNSLSMGAIALGTIALGGTVVWELPVGVPAVASSSRYRGKPIRRTSSPAKIALAQHLQQIGAKMYGAYWCHHCHKQKQMFGKQAIARPAEVCQAAEIEAWEINGKFYTGTQSLEKLANLSGYQGSRQF
ncbi:MAG: hypothetical protein GDA56_07175 [Hormoscilla sp. GM7CHS1pb]|nr:hypothetical protein [Hormoscilla sp. GM7CHS1pb]